LICENSILKRILSYYLKPGQAFNSDISEDSTGFVISFKKEFIELYEKKSFELINTLLFNQFLTTPLIKINKDLNGFMKNIAGEMLQEYRNYFDLRFEI
jgi:hypothetical protein